MSDVGRIVSLHIHPAKGGELMVPVDLLQLEARKGIVEDKRYFGKSKRQVTLIEREQLDSHAGALGIDGIAAGQARANIETSAINLHALLGRHVQIGEAVLLLYENRTPCYKMDAVCQGLRKLMENGKQGVLAQVIKSGTVRPGDPIRAVGDHVRSL
jgi:MOSC domain-containing protein YiiM